MRMKPVCGLFEEGDVFQMQQPAFPVQPGRKTTETVICGKYAMTRNNNADRVCAKRRAHGTGCARLADAPRQFAVGCMGAMGDGGGGGAPDGLLKHRARSKVERNIMEGHGHARKIIFQ